MQTDIISIHVLVARKTDPLFTRYEIKVICFYYSRFPLRYILFIYFFVDEELKSQREQEKEYYDMYFFIFPFLIIFFFLLFSCVPFFLFCYLFQKGCRWMLVWMPGSNSIFPVHVPRLHMKYLYRLFAYGIRLYSE